MGKLVFCFFCLLAFVGMAAAQIDGSTVYRMYCVECHGARLEGNKAAPLVKDTWLYGRERKYFKRNIKHGIPNTTMIAWGNVLNEEEIDALVDYIINAQTNPPNVPQSLPDTIDTEHYLLNVEILVSDGLETPWGIEFIDPRTALVTEKPGRLRWMRDGGLDPTPIEGLPKVIEKGGMMDVALDPEYASNGWIYLAHAHSVDKMSARNARALTRVIRGRVEGHSWKDQEVIFQAPERAYHTGGNRWGGRMIFDQHGDLIFSIGDMAKGEWSQEPEWVNGKTFRIHPDGSIPPDNPFVGRKGAIEAINTLGNRNVQGFSTHPRTGEIWMAEHGPMGGDEVNVLETGLNYGWPVITYGRNYDGAIVSNITHRDGMEQPVHQWTPSIAVCAVEFNTSVLFKRWGTDLLVGALAYEEIRRLRFDGRKLVSEEVMLKGYGRVRDLKIGPDGALYVLFNEPDLIVRLSPEDDG